MTILEVVLISVLVGIVAIGFGVLVFKRDTAKENRRRAANQLAGIFRGLGLKETPPILEDYGVGDYSGMAEKIIAVCKRLSAGPDAIVTEFGQVFESCLAAKLTTETGRAYIAAKLEDAAKATDPSVVTNAPQAGVV